jgi:hypothetical protein
VPVGKVEYPKGIPSSTPDNPVTKLTGQVGRKLPPLIEGAAGMTERVARKTRKPRKAKPTKTAEPGKMSLVDKFHAALSLCSKPTPSIVISEGLGITQQRGASVVNQLKRAKRVKKHGSGKNVTWSAI